MENKEEKITFEEYGIEFTDEDFEGVELETLVECREMLDKVLKKIEK